MEEIIAGSVCRLCLWKTAPLIPIHGSNSLREKIRQLIPIDIYPGNGLSQLICGECVYKIELFNQFRVSALKCDDIQQEYQQLWKGHQLTELAGSPWSSAAQPKIEKHSIDASPPSIRQSETKNDSSETWITEVDQEEVMALTPAVRRRSNSLYSRAPDPGPPGCPYICRYCKKELSTSAALAHHEHKHVDNVCLLCEEKLPSMGALRLHLRTVCTVSGAITEEPKEDKSDGFKCSTCQRLFCSSLSLWRHCIFLSHNHLQGFPEEEGTQPSVNIDSGPFKRPLRRQTGSVGRGGGLCGYGRGRGKKIIVRRRAYVYEKTPCDVCGRVFQSSHGMLIHRKHIHK